MYWKNGLWCRFVAVVLALVLMLSVLAACGGGGKEKETPTLSPTSTMTVAPTAISTPTGTTTAAPTATPTPTAIPTATPTPTPEGPVKIGAICSWSGPAAMSGLAYGDNIAKLVERQVKDMGGILGGRQLDIVKYDNHLSVAEAQAGALKLMVDDKVSSIIWGGVSAAECEAVAAFCEEHHLLYTPYSSITDLAKMKYVLGAMPPIPVTCQAYIDLALKIAKAKTIGFLGTEISDVHVRLQVTKDAVEAAGVKTVFEEYVPEGTTDFTPYLTKLKYANPDVAILESSMGEFYITIAKEIPGIGGLGNMKIGILGSGEGAKSIPAADGWYMSTLWYPGLDTPGSVKFVNDYKAMFNRVPDATNVYFYNSSWCSIAAIMAAGTTDRETVAQVARSGKVEWESPQGHVTWGADGLSDMPGFMVQIKDKQLIPVEKLER